MAVGKDLVHELMTQNNLTTMISIDEKIDVIPQ
jgi:hypothetical protein